MKDIIGYEGIYAITEDGDVFSHEKEWNHHRKGKIRKKSFFMKKQKLSTGYLVVSLRKEKRMKTFLVHRLVASAFIDNPLLLPCVNHKDFNKENNSSSNLEWCTYKQNTQHTQKHGRLRHLIGEDAPWSRLKENDVRSIRNMYKTGSLSQQFIADKFNISREHARDIINRKKWRHVL